MNVRAYYRKFHKISDKVLVKPPTLLRQNAISVRPLDTLIVLEKPANHIPGLRQLRGITIRQHNNGTPIEISSSFKFKREPTNSVNNIPGPNDWNLNTKDRPSATDHFLRAA